MEKTKNFISKIILGILAVIGFSSTADAQCNAGEVEVFIDIATDQWGYELYWELVPTGQACGGTAIFAGGNTNVGCAGGGAQTATSAAGYGSSTTIREPQTPTGFCLTIGQSYDLIAVDDWGDGGSIFTMTSQGLVFDMASNASNETFTFTAIAHPTHNLVLGNTVLDPDGWELDYIRPLNDKYYPMSQLTAAESSMGVAVSNFGLQDATNAYARLNIDAITGPSTYTTVFTDTLQFGTIQKDSSTYAYKTITDTSWFAVSDFRYQYIVYQDSTDGLQASDTITNYFSITNDFWSRVEQQSGYPYGESSYFPGTSSLIDIYEWGSFFYFPNGSSYKLDTFKATFYHSTSATVTSANYQLRIYEVALQGTQLDLTTDLLLRGIGLDTVNFTAGSTSYSNITTLYDAVTGLEYSFTDNKLYFISIYQENAVAPYLSDGSVVNGMYIDGQPMNHDFSVYGNSNAYPFYNSLSISENFTPTSYEYGWSSGAEPAMSISLKNIFSATEAVKSKELENVTITPNPTSGQFTVSLSLANSSDVQYIITDVSGRLILMEKSTDVTTATKYFDLSKFASGVYLVNIVTNDGATTKRIIKK